MANTHVLSGHVKPISSLYFQVMSLLASNEKDCKYVLIDTPGQIEVFTWSASGNIITEALVR